MALKRKSRTEVAKLKDELWQLCRQIQFKKYGDVCYTCDKPISGSNRHLGHFIPSASGGAFLRWDLRNLRPQCYFDNINLGGHGSEYYRRLVEREGQEYVDQLFRDKQKTIKCDKWWLMEKISEYEKILERDK